MKNERPIIACLVLLLFLLIFLVGAAIPEAQRISDVALGAAIAWGGQVVVFYFRKKGPG